MSQACISELGLHSSVSDLHEGTFPHFHVFSGSAPVNKVDLAARLAGCIGSRGGRPRNVRNLTFVEHLRDCALDERWSIWNGCHSCLVPDVLDSNTEDRCVGRLCEQGRLKRGLGLRTHHVVDEVANLAGGHGLWVTEGHRRRRTVGGDCPEQCGIRVGLVTQGEIRGHPGAKEARAVFGDIDIVLVVRSQAFVYHGLHEGGHIGLDVGDVAFYGDLCGGESTASGYMPPRVKLGRQGDREVIHAMCGAETLRERVRQCQHGG